MHFVPVDPLLASHQSIAGVEVSFWDGYRRVSRGREVEVGVRSDANIDRARRGQIPSAANWSAAEGLEGGSERDQLAEQGVEFTFAPRQGPERAILEVEIDRQ